MKLLIFILAIALSLATSAAIDIYEFEDPLLQKRFDTLSVALRCPKCQNQSLADSDAMIAEDLRKELYRLLNEGLSNQEITQFMVERYGEFVLYEPPLKKSTLLLWFGPLMIFLLIVVVLLMVLRSRKNAP